MAKLRVPCPKDNSLPSALKVVELHHPCRDQWISQVSVLHLFGVTSGSSWPEVGVTNNWQLWRSIHQLFTKTCQIETYGYGSIPIHTIFNGMNIHKSQLFWCELQGTRFWHTATCCAIQHCPIKPIQISHKSPAKSHDAAAKLWWVTLSLSISHEQYPLVI